MLVPTSETIDLIKKQALLVARLGHVANTQRRALSFINSNYQDDSEDEGDQQSAVGRGQQHGHQGNERGNTNKGELAELNAILKRQQSAEAVSPPRTEIEDKAPAFEWRADSVSSGVPSPAFASPSSTGAGESHQVTPQPQAPLSSVLVPPSSFSHNSLENINKKTTQPQITLEHIYGYSSSLPGCARSNIALVDEDTIIYPAGSIAVVESISNSRQRFFKGHASSSTSTTTGIRSAVLPSSSTPSPITCLAYNAARRIVATGQIGGDAEGGDGSRVFVWRVDEPHAEVPFYEEIIPNVSIITNLAFTTDGSRLLVVGANASKEESDASPQTLCVLNLSDNSSEALRKGPIATLVDPSLGHILSASWIVDARIEQNTSFVTVGDGALKFWFLSQSDAADHDQKMMSITPSKALCGGQIIPEHCCFTSVASTPDATYVGCSKGLVHVFDGRRLVRIIAGHNGPIHVITARPAKSEVLTGGADGFVRVWDEHTLRHTATFDLNQSSRCRLPSNSVRALGVCSRDEGGLSFSFIVGTAIGSLYKMAAAPNSANTGGFKQSTIVTSHVHCLSNTTPEAKSERSEKGYCFSVCKASGGLASHPTQPIVVTGGGADGSLRAWDMGRRRQTFRVDVKAPVCCVAFNADGTKVAAGDAEGTLSLHNGRNLVMLSSLAFLRRLKKLKNNGKGAVRVNCIKFSPNGALIAAGFSDGSLRIFSVGGGDSDAIELVGLLGVFSASNSSTGGVGNIDWSVDGLVLRLDDASSSVCGGGAVYHSPTTPPQIRFVRVAAANDLALASALECRDVTFATCTCVFGWSVQGVWSSQKVVVSEEEAMSSFTVNALATSAAPNTHASEEVAPPLLAVAENTGTVAVYHYPCIGSGLDEQNTLRRRPVCSARLMAHTSIAASALPELRGVGHVIFANKGGALVSFGASDGCLIQWAVTQSSK